MSIEQLREDLKQITGAAGGMAGDIGVASFLQDNLLPWLESLTHEVSEMDGAIEDLVHESADVLHSENAAVFAGIIAGGLAIAAELTTRIGNDQRLLAVVRDFRQLAVQGREILEEIVIPDEDEDEDEEAEDGPETKPAHEGKGA